MSRIHRLDPVVANQIAAGEVVERPASVVKELVENSLDAAASSIEVVIGAELKTLEVRDTGMGMDADDLALCVERHTTSKLTRIEDLDESVTLGFRGEALAAIASVSELTIASRASGASVGHRLVVAFGQRGTLEPLPMGEGTRVRVARIFEKHPARLKSLKSSPAEFGAIQLVVQALAIGRPDVRFQLVYGGRLVLETPGRGQALGALAAVFGRELAERLLPIDYVTERGAHLRGYVAPADVGRANRHGQGLYINGRWVLNWRLRTAVEEAFRPILPERRFPYFWLWVDLPPAEVDPNVHPTKAEVRVAREEALRAILFRVVRDTLAQQSPVRRWEPEAPSPMERPAAETRALQTFLFEKAGEEAREPEPHGAWGWEALKPLGQWHAKYILAQGPGGLYLIDQHAAHERVYFEHFQKLGEAVTTSQPLLFSVAETLSATEWAAWQAHEAQLRALGFEVDSLGGTTVAVRAVPQAFRDMDSHQGLLRVVLQLLSGEEAVSGSEHPVSWAEAAHYAMAACKAAIKANRPLSMVEMQELLNQLSRTEDPRGCPHGRPTMIVLTLEEVDRRFGRRG
ncbi:MAG: DNA mismatch repair endonuclease MutL [Firmicutes bacterium]|nr:DNA mismatch repair endonuclease MutL [Bacillota bacterium]